MALGEDKPVFIPKALRNKEKTVSSATLPKSECQKPSIASANRQISSENADKSVRSRSKAFVFGWKDSEDTSKLSDLQPIAFKSTKRDEIESDLCSSWRTLSLHQMSTRDWRFMREEFSISLKPSNICCNPIRHWKEVELPAPICSALERMHFETPTAIQRQVIPAILSGKDVVGISPTGSGKTAAFSIPLIVKLAEMPRLTSESMADGPLALVIAPTRELAQQINNSIRQFSLPLGIRSLSIIGGHSITEQSFEMRDGMEIVVGTPGRLRDCIEQHLLVLNQVRFLVLDEADRMMDMGFGDDLEMLMGQIMHNSISNRQVCMFSATMPGSVTKLIARYLSNDYLTVSIGNITDPVDSVNQIIEMISASDMKTEKAIEILKQDKFKAPIIAFCNTKKSVDDLSKVSIKNGIRIVSLHGGKSQQARELALEELSSGKASVLIATDVAGRGIDIPNVSLVLNYDMPVNIEIYTHRIGRTGRAGAKGTAITFVTEEDSEVFWELGKFLKKTKCCSVPEAFWNHPKTRTKCGLVETKKRHEQIVYSI